MTYWVESDTIGEGARLVKELSLSVFRIALSVVRHFMAQLVHAANPFKGSKQNPHKLVMGTTHLCSSSRA
eukprot:364096-Chlamydomonas_euryale.AAC.7